MIRPLRVLRLVGIGMLIISAITSKAQKNLQSPVHFKKAMVSASMELTGINPIAGPMKAAGASSITKVFLQFNDIPDSRKRQVLKARGIELLEYIPENTYLANVKGKWTVDALKSIGVTVTIPMNRSFKQPEINRNVAGTGRYHLMLSPGLDTNQVRNNIYDLFRENDGQADQLVFLNRRLAEINLTQSALDKLVDQDFIEYIMPVQKMIAMNSDATDNLVAQVVQRGGNGVPGLNGQGVVMGVGDEGRIDHIDNGYNEEGQDYNSQYHSTHVAGTMIGAGIVNPLMKGFAPKATLLVDLFNTIIYRTPDYYQNKRMVLTNNSYGVGSYCVPYSGEYSGYSGQVDQQLLDFPNLMHVFAAGNSGDLQCGNYPVGYRSIDNSFQAAKNVLTVGGTSHDGLSNKFSRGPVNDGRLKPEISGIGNAMLSTIMGNGYGPNQGTSMSAPQVTGAMALLYERYRQLNNDLDPPGDLAKAIICNTATDIGTKGVDFSTGFGWLNLKKAIDVVNDRSYRSGTIEQGQEQSIEINLDKEVFDFRVMLYWHDQPSSYYTLKNLVNDLDLTVQLPDGSIYDPMVLDTSAVGVTLPAVMGKDHLNNIEQVVIGHALPGRYTIRIKGYKVPFGPQTFRIVYNWQEPGLELLQPIGGEQWKPGELRGIHWLDAGHDGDTYKFEYSLDNGLNWVNIPGLTGTYNRMDWTLPQVQSAAAKIRITNTVTGSSTVSAPFVILPEINYSITSSCSAEALVKWSKPTGIDSVAVLLYKAGDFIQQTITTDSSWILTGLRSGPGYWITVQPILGGKLGERSIAKEIITANTNCTPSGAPGDIALRNILLPPTAREATSTAKSGPIAVIVELMNTGNTIVADSVFLDLVKDGIGWGRDTLVRSFAAGEQFNWTTSYSFPATPGTTTKIQATIIVKGDTLINNNQVDSSWRYLNNAAIELPYSDDFSTLVESRYSKPGIIGVPGADHWDFNSSSAAVSFHTPKSFVSVCKIEQQPLQLIGTFNLGNFNLTDDIRLNLDIPSFSDLDSKIYIRGSDVSSWLLLPIHDAITGIDDTKNMNLSSVLAKGNQKFSSSFQIRIENTTSSYVQELNLLKSVRIFAVKSDLALVDLNYTRARVTDGDSMHIVLSAINKMMTTNGPFTIGLKTPDGQVQSVKLDSLGAGMTAGVAFTVFVRDWPNAVSPLIAWVNDPLDGYPDDDSLQATLAYYRKISQYPYLQGFEDGEAGWGRTFLYALSSKLTESVAPFHAANGNIFWGTRRVDYNDEVAFPVSAGYLVSPLFDITSLKKPWLSMSVNKQLCEGMDSVLLQYSLDTGRTWKVLPPGPNTVNWYDLPGMGSWKSCGNDYWQVVSTSLPATNSGIMVRVLLSGTNALADEFPRLPGGLFVDDVHVFDLVYPVFDEPGPVSQLNLVQQADQEYFISKNQVVAAASTSGFPAGNRLTIPAPENNKTYQGNPVLPKTWIFNGQPGTSPDARVRLFFTHNEVMNWLAAVPCDTCQQKRSPYDLSVFRYAGPDALVNALEYDNTPGYAETWSPDAFDLVPYESGYYAELPVSAYGEFYIGLDQKGSGLYFTAERQAGADIVLLNWSVTDPSGISSFEIERAPRSEGPLVFEKIGTVSATADQTRYYFRDIWLKPPGAWHYRLKIVYKNGDTRYSVIKTISFDNTIQVKVYPNPSTDGKVTILLQNTEGKKVSLALFDQGGRYLWGQKLEPIGQQQVIPINLGDGRLATGVYALKITTETEKKTIQLVISRN